VQAVRLRDPGSLHDLIAHHAESATERRILFLPLEDSASIDRCVAALVSQLTSLAVAAWPLWFGDIEFDWYRDDALGNSQLEQQLRRLEIAERRISRPWATRAIKQVARGLSLTPGLSEFGLHLNQVCLAISRTGLIVVVPFDVDANKEQIAALVHVAEWFARSAPVSVIAALPASYPEEAPIERLCFGAWQLADGAIFSGSGQHGNGDPPATITEAVASRVKGLPHPFSAIEKRVYATVRRDPFLAPLFAFNQIVPTVQGGRPCVDLLWAEGRLVVELDGHSDHSPRAAFERDRHRDYELTLSGYIVLRIANDEVERDLEGSIEKIRDLVKYRQDHST